MRSRPSRPYPRRRRRPRQHNSRRRRRPTRARRRRPCRPSAAPASLLRRGGWVAGEGCDSRLGGMQPVWKGAAMAAAAVAAAGSDCHRPLSESLWTRRGFSAAAKAGLRAAAQSRSVGKLSAATRKTAASSGDCRSRRGGPLERAMLQSRVLVTLVRTDSPKRCRNSGHVSESSVPGPPDHCDRDCPYARGPEIRAFDPLVLGRSSWGLGRDSLTCRICVDRLRLQPDTPQHARRRETWVPSRIAIIAFFPGPLPLHHGPGPAPC